MTNIVIIGLGTSGFFAARSALSTNKVAKVTVIEKRPYDMFSPCALPYAISKLVDFDKLKYELPEMKNFVKLLAHEAIELKPQENVVIVRDLNSNKLKNIYYDKLIIATGSSPVIPKIRYSKALLGKDIHVVSNLENAKSVLEASNKAKSVLVVGAGPVGLESAVALNKAGKNVLVVEKLSRLLPNNIDEDMSEIIAQKLTEKGLSFKFNSELKEIEGSDKIEYAVINHEKVYPHTLVVCVGTKPNAELASKAGIELGITGGIKVSSKLETSISNIYSCGDCSETISAITQKPILAKLASIAYRQGEIAGINAGGGSAIYEGALATFATELHGVEIASTGLTTEQALNEGYEAISTKLKSRTKPEYMPDSEEIIMKITFERDTGKILGAQGIGNNVTWRVNIIGLAIQKNINIMRLKNLELAYTPALCEVYDILAMLIDYSARKLKKA
ncbi:MAG: FAD-dependent oxidoreductase [Candidatus Thermoplasmatota archaeon]|nr:FAD-dependent oxidoreductase [Candidatus Thermoplasmatota archaeon]